MAKRTCADCGTVLNEGELTFTVCDACWEKVLHAFEPDTDAAAFAALRQHRSGLGTEFDEALCGVERRIATLRARIRELEARVTGGLAGEPRQAYRGEGAAASDEQPRPASPPTFSTPSPDWVQEARETVEYAGDELKRLAAENARLRAANEGLRALLNRCAPQVGSTDDPQYELACEVNRVLSGGREPRQAYRWAGSRRG